MTFRNAAGGWDGGDDGYYDANYHAEDEGGCVRDERGG